MRPRAIVLLSAGLDSTVNLALALEQAEVIMVLTFDYGQLAAQRENEFATAIATRYCLEHRVIDLPFLKTNYSALTGSRDSLPRVEESALEDKTLMSKNATLVWVPNRNGVFVNVAAAVAEDRAAQLIVAGFNAEEAVTFTDNSREFITASNKCLSLSTRLPVTLVSYTSDLEKTEIVRLGLAAKAPLDLVWACYDGGEVMCGHCESCQRLIRAFRNAGVLDLISGRIEIPC